ncbi:DUF1146 domain-containing protein [Lactobacillus sp. DCY120]|uniref:DUF1146 domain-containing protein n=1 Tax=Bombilactobacillus apium TaxID=2675299 RepID=A0A850R535_9LACO|nr:DUF1146 family protein [Bombilactobacillus apium]NVY95645.1 DUF1146 domain-containing protein [Bombilactobacillus apium]
MQQLGIQNLLSIFSLIFFIWLAFLAIQSVNWDQILQAHSNRYGKLLIVLLAIALGYLVNSAFINLLQSCQGIRLLFG